MQILKKQIQTIKMKWEKIWENQEGIAVVEVILIMVVFIALVAIFKTQLTTIVNNIFSTITNNSSAI